jgi:hypothetical protein
MRADRWRSGVFTPEGPELATSAPESTTSSIDAPVGAASASPFFEPAFLLPFFFFGRSHSQIGINESTCRRIHSVYSELVCTGKKTYEANIRKELREYPDTRRRNDDGDDVEDQPNDGNSEEQPNEAEDTDREVPHTKTHDGWPEREHHTRKHDGDKGSTSEVRGDLAAFVEPHKVMRSFNGCALLWHDIEHLRRGGFGARGSTTLNAEEEGKRNQSSEKLLCFGLVGHFGCILDLGVGRSKEGFDRGFT